METWPPSARQGPRSFCREPGRLLIRPHRRRIWARWTVSTRTGRRASSVRRQRRSHKPPASSGCWTIAASQNAP